MALPRIRLIWGGAKQRPGRWRLGLWGVFERQIGSRPRVAVSVRGVLAWSAGLALAGYLAGATALYFWFERSPHNRVTWADTLLMPARWDHVRVLRGRMMIAEGLEDMRARRWSEANMKLRVGIARAPAEWEARLALAEFYLAANRRPAAMEVLAGGVAHGYPGRPYLSSFFAVAGQGEDFNAIVAACERLNPPDDEERAWLLAQHVSTLIAAQRPAEALALAEWQGAGASAQMREARALALVDLGRSGEAIAFLAAWLDEVPAHRAQILRLQARAFREAGKTDEMNAALENLRHLAPADPRSYVYGIVQRWLAGERAGAEVALDGYIQRFAGSAQNLLLAASALTEAKAPAMVRRCVEEARLHGFPAKAFLPVLAQAQLEAGEWRAAGDTLTELKPLLTEADVAERFSCDWMERLAAVASPEEAAPESLLLDVLQQRPLPLRVYRQTAEALIRAERHAAAKSVLAIGDRAYPMSRTLARLREDVDAASRMAAAARPAPVAVAAAPVETAATFFAELERLESEERWDEAAQAIRRIRVAKPVWLAPRESEVFEAQMRIAVRTGDTPELLAAARLFLTGERERALRVVEFARGLGAGGRQRDGERLIVEVLRKTADFPPALQLRQRWQKAELERKQGSGS